MDNPQVEPYEARLIAVAAIRVKPGHRKPNAASVKKIAESIEEVGLLQPVGVVAATDEEGMYDLVFGGHRLGAHKLLKRDVIEAKVLDIDPDDATAIMHAENLFRDELSNKEKLEAVAAWAAHYKAKHPESYGKAAMTQGAKDRHAAKAKDASEVTAEASEPAPEPKAERPADALAKLTGKSPRQSSKMVRIAENLTEPQRAALSEAAVSIDNMDKVAAIADQDKRDKAVTLIASGMAADAAIVVAKAPENATLEIVANPDADGYKPEEEMDDDEWFDAFCGETAARFQDPATFKASAILWRQTRPARAEFKAKTKKAMGQAKVGPKGVFYNLMTRVIGVAHPKDWPVCGPCGGSGKVGSGKCQACYGNAFALKTDAA